MLPIDAPASRPRRDAEQLAEAKPPSHRPNLEELPLGRLIARTVAAARPGVVGEQKPPTRRRPRVATLARLKAIEEVASDLREVKRHQLIASRRRALRELYRPPKADTSQPSVQRPLPLMALASARQAPRSRRTECSGC